MPVLVVRVRPKAFPFLQLPREIRDVIYELVLVEPPLYERRHISTCHYTSLSPSCAEKPPFATVETPFNKDHSCYCAKRRYLAILSVNTQVHQEAGRVLWGKNVFSFAGVCSFNQWFASISAARRENLRHIAIYLIRLHERDTAGNQTLDFSEQLLPNLLKCENLRRLDLGPVRLPDGFVETLARRLPRLKHLRMAGLEILTSRPAAARHPEGNAGIGTSTWVYGLVHVDIRIDDMDTAGFSTLDFAFRSNPTRWDARARAVSEQLGRSLRDGRWGRYCDTHSTATLRLPQEVHPIEVPLVGLPNSPATCARFQRECEEAERLRKRLDAREEELRRGEAMRLARELDRRQEAESHEAAKIRESIRTEKQLKQEETRQSLQRTRHIRDHLATRKAERKRVRRAK
ncbi:hypothetical protein PG995_014986 [Apiospora arundinis]